MQFSVLNCGRSRGFLATVVALAIGSLCCRPAAAAVVYYNAGSGLMTLINSGANYTAGLGTVQIYVASSAYLPSSLDPLTDWTSQIVSTSTGGNAGGNYMGWSFVQAEQNTDALPAGVYNLATLPGGLSPSDFGYYYQTTFPVLQTYSFGPSDTSGAVEFGNIQGGAATPSIVEVSRAVPSEVDWTAAGNGAWATATNWTVAGGSTQRVPHSGDTATFDNGSGTSASISLAGNQTAGSLWFNSGSTVYTIAQGGGGSLTLSNTATIWVDAGLHTIAVPLALSGSLTVDTEPAGNVPVNSAGLTVSGQLSGNSALIKMGAGILDLTNTDNLYNGKTSITGGTLVAAGGGSLGASGSVTISNAQLEFSGAGAFSGGISLSGSGGNTIQADTGVMTLSGAISGSGALTKTGNGTLAVSNSDNSFSGGTTVAAGTLQLAGANALSSTSAVTIAGGTLLDLNGFGLALANISGGGSVTNTSSTTATLKAAYVGGTASFAAAIQDGAGKVAVGVPAGGLLTLSNTANTYSGGTTISSGGTLSVSADANLGAGSVSINGGMLQATSGFTSNAGRNFALGGAAALDVASGQTLSIAGAIGGSGALVKSDNGTLVLLGANTYQGGTTINGGTLSIANDGALGNSSGTVTINDGALDVQGNATSSRPIVVNGPGNSILQVNSGTYTAMGPISGGNALTIQGNGTFATAGTISQGVVLNGGNLAIGTSSVTGTLSLGSGQNYGGLNITGTGGSLTFKLQESGSSDVIDLSGGHGGVTFSPQGTAAATVNLISGPLPDTSPTYTLITGDYSGAGTANGHIETQLLLNCALGFSGSWSDAKLKDASDSSYNDYSVTLTGPTQWKAASGGLSTNSNWTSNAPTNPGGVGMFGSLGSGTVSLPSGGYSLHGTDLQQFQQFVHLDFGGDRCADAHRRHQRKHEPGRGGSSQWKPQHSGAAGIGCQHQRDDVRSSQLLECRGCRQRHGRPGPCRLRHASLDRHEQQL